MPMTGRLAFATALSNRVADWIRSTNPVSDVISTPRPGALLGERLAKDDSVKRVGILELDALPAELSDDLGAAAPTIRLVDGSAQFAMVRRDIDPAEQQILVRSDAIAVAALDQGNTATTSDAGTLAGLIEKHARLAGAEEAYIAVAPNLATDRRLTRVSKPIQLADRFAVRASIAYKGAWLRRTRTFARDHKTARADAWFEGVIRGIEAGKPISGQLAAYVEALSDATLEFWMVESCVGSYPLSVIASSRMPGRDPPIEGGFLRTDDWTIAPRRSLDRYQPADREQSLLVGSTRFADARRYMPVSTGTNCVVNMTLSSGISFSRPISMNDCLSAATAFGSKVPSVLKMPICSS